MSDELDGQLLREADGDLTQLDLDVARKIMGWHVCVAPECSTPNVGSRGLWNEHRNGSNWPHGKIQDFAPSFSIAAAFLVVEKMREQEWFVEIANVTTEWLVSFIYDNNERKDASALAATLPEAICRAALATLTEQEKTK